MNRAFVPFLALLLSPVIPAHAGPDPAAQEAVARSALFSTAPRFQLTCRLTVIDATGDQKIRDLLVTTLRVPGEERFLAQITAPTFLRSLKFLRVQTKEGTGTWLKTSRGVQRLAPGSDPEPLFGSDFTTTDFQPGTRDWTASPKTGAGQTVVERPAEARWGWVRQELTIRDSDRLLVKSEFFDSLGTVVRRYEVKSFDSSGLPRRVILEDLKKSQRSELVILVFDETKPIPSSLFAPGSL